MVSHLIVVLHVFGTRKSLRIKIRKIKRVLKSYFLALASDNCNKDKKRCFAKLDQASN